MNTDRACENLSRIADDEKEGVSPFRDACRFAILRMRELDSLKKALQGIVTEFVKEIP